MTSARRVLVTGGGTGIGRAISTAFLEAGDSVVIAQSTEERARRAVGRFQTANPHIYGVGADLSESSGCRVIVERAVELLEGLDIIVNNAALSGAPVLVPFEDTEDSLLDRIIEVNLKAPFRITRNAVPALAPGSVVINIGSVGGFSAQRHAAAYCAAKGGLELLTKAMALELADRRIRVVGVAPGDITTTRSNRAARARSDASLDQYTRTVPLQRRGTGAEVAATVLFAASDQASYITGTTIVVDGGWLTY